MRIVHVTSYVAYITIPFLTVIHLFTLRHLTLPRVISPLYLTFRYLTLQLTQRAKKRTMTQAEKNRCLVQHWTYAELNFYNYIYICML